MDDFYVQSRSDTPKLTDAPRDDRTFDLRNALNLELPQTPPLTPLLDGNVRKPRYVRPSDLSTRHIWRGPNGTPVLGAIQPGEEVYDWPAKGQEWMAENETVLDEILSNNGQGSGRPIEGPGFSDPVLTFEAQAFVDPFMQPGAEPARDYLAEIEAEIGYVVSGNLEYYNSYLPGSLLED